MLIAQLLTVDGIEPAIHGMRNPHNSWQKSDSINDLVGQADFDLALKLSKAGTDHSKYLRMINVYFDILAPLYFYKELDTYKVGTVCNSCSTMHSISEKEFDITDFSYEHLSESSKECLETTIRVLNACRSRYLISKDKKDWWQMIQLLPSSYNQRRTYMISYQALKNIYQARKNHKLDEWHRFCDFIKLLPYSEWITN